MSVRILHSADGEPIALHDLGGRGTPLLLTHGNGLNAGMWAAVTPLLSDRFRLWGLDFRGQGAAGAARATGSAASGVLRGSRQSADASGELSVERDRFAEDVLVALEAIGTGPALTAGHSLGGVATIKAEQRWPGTFRATWLFEPVLVPVGFERPGEFNSTLIEIARRRRQVFDSVGDAYKRFSSKPPFDSCRPEAVRAYVEIGTFPTPEGGVQLSCAGETEARVFESNERFDFAELASVRCPTLVACGGTSHLGETPAMVAPLVADALGDARLERFDHLTHFGPMEDPETIAASILAQLGPYAD
jgi:pimeloyl-ACP methyl ester carboxylesterase